MAQFRELDYLFAIGLIFSFLDAFNIGANDVANSFATSVSSRSLTLKQACLIAAICEFGGAVLVGGRVADTIKDSIIDFRAFENNAGLQLLGFTCAITTSAIWLLIATRYSWPVSTTYSIVAALVGVGFATAGPGTVLWGWHGGKGVGTIFAGFLIAPLIAAVFAAIIFLITKYGVLKPYQRTENIKIALACSPIYFFVVAAVLTMSIVYQGKDNGKNNLGIKDLSPGAQAGIVISVSVGVALLSVLFWLPYVYRQVEKKDFGLRWYHIFLGPLLWKRGEPEHPAEANHPTAAAAEYPIPDYRVYDYDADREHFHMMPFDGTGAHDDAEADPNPGSPDSQSVRSGASSRADEKRPTEAHAEVEKSWFHPKVVLAFIKDEAWPAVYRRVTYGTTVDVITLQTSRARDADRIAAMLYRAQQFPNRAEHLFSFVQVLTACVASFGHGANDVSNAIAPFSAIYHIWNTRQAIVVVDATGKPTPVDVETWQLAVGGILICLGLSTYGYNIMRVLGNRMTLMSPSRGFSMELGSAITVILASQNAIPVSTTMCIVGATLGVALCNGDFRAFNWRGLAWIVLGWIMTVPVVAIAAGCFMGFIINAPRRL